MRVVGSDGQQVGILTTAEALTLARAKGLDLVEVAPAARPPVCRIVDYGKYRYEQAKKERENKKHQHTNRVKEVQLRPSIDPHDFGVKLNHAIEFLCDDMKVKVTLRFKGRENAHKEFGFQTVQKFINDVSLYGSPDASPRLAGRNLNVMISPLPANKRAAKPKRRADEPPPPKAQEQDHDSDSTEGDEGDEGDDANDPNEAYMNDSVASTDSVDARQSP